MRLFLQRVFNTLVKGNGANSRIARGMGLVAIFIFVGKVAGAVKEMAVAYRFGVSEIVDAYTIAYTVATLPAMIWGVVLVSVFVPLSKRLEPNERHLFVSQLLGLSLILGLAAAVLTAYVLPLMVPIIWSDMSLPSQQNLQLLFKGLSPMVAMIFIAVVFAAQLLALEQHSNTLMDAFPSLLLAGVVMLSHDQNSVWPFIYGGIVGVLAQVAGLLFVLKNNNAIAPISLSFSSKGWAIFKNAFGIMIFGQFIISLAVPIDLYFASKMGEGAVASFGYAHRITLLFLGLGATAVGRAILPVLSSTDTLQEKQLIALKWMKLLLVLGSVVAVVAWLAMPHMIKLLFERGAFSALDTQNVSTITRYGLLQLPFYFAGIVIVQLLLSHEHFVAVFQSSVVALVFKIIAGYIGAHYFGVPGIMGSWAVVYLASLLFLIHRSNSMVAQPSTLSNS